MKRIIKISMWAGALLAAIAIVAFTLIGNKDKANAEINKELVAVPFTVTAAYVTEASFSDNATFRGSVEAKNIVTIYSEADGKLVFSAIERGKVFRKGELIGSIDKAIREANNQINSIGLDKAKLDYANAKTNANRYEALVKENNASEVEVENARLQLNAASLQLSTLQQQIHISKKQVGQTQIFAPASGIVIEKKANASDYVQPGTPLGIIADLNTVIVKVFIPESYIPKIKAGNSVSLFADVYPNTVFSGTIKHIIPVANEAKAFPVEIELFNNKPHKLMAGMSMNVSFTANKSITVLTIPRTSIVGDFSKPSVYRIDADKKPMITPIKIGRDFGTSVEVIEGLHKNEIVVTAGQSNIEKGKILSNYKIITKN